MSALAAHISKLKLSSVGGTGSTFKSDTGSPCSRHQYAEVKRVIPGSIYHSATCAVSALAANVSKLRLVVFALTTPANQLLS
jgi:hypothetical protein